MFPLHQGNKLVFQISSSNPHHQNSSEDRILGYASPDGCSSTVLSNNNNMGKSRRRKLVVAALDQTIIENSKDNKKKKMMIHRENERQRRQEMATLYSRLRSLLPLEFIKGKRSTSDHMNEAVNYIKHLQNRIKTLDAKRDEFKKFPKISTDVDRRCTTGSSLNSDKVNLPSCFTVQPSSGGVQILVSGGFREDGLPLISISSVLEILLGRGLTVVSCVSSQVNERLLHTIQIEVYQFWFRVLNCYIFWLQFCVSFKLLFAVQYVLNYIGFLLHIYQVDDVESLDLSALEQKLAKALPTSRSTISK
ncbi:putative transcription factor bHLH family [Rosa chinensis]|uniref:Putative transcription factor bHLH family n=1 Tax=Rosa chinensis TaxID=74649 RepID=A0A2P6SMP7_ROSCH|nr:putative transcription factor bHLH family [Rosa chinensis]